MNGETFGELIRTSRRGQNKSLQDVATALGVTPVYISEVERGKRLPFKPERLTALAEVLKIDINVLRTTAWVEKKMIEWDPATASDKQIRALVEMARGGFSDTEWDAILRIATKKQKDMF